MILRCAPSRFAAFAGRLLLATLSLAMQSYVTTAAAEEPARQTDHAAVPGVARPLARLEGTFDEAFVPPVVAFSRDGKLILTAGGGEARVWDAVTFQPVTGRLKHGEPVRSAGFSADGTKLLTAGGESARVWDARTGQFASPRLRHGRDVPVTSASLSPDGSRVLTIGVRPDKGRGLRLNPPTPAPTPDERSIYVWDVVTGELAVVMEHPKAVRYAEFSPDGHRVLSVSGFLSGRAHLWDAATGEQLVKPLEAACISGRPAAFSVDGKRFALTGWYEVVICDAASGKERARIGGYKNFEHHDLPQSIALSPDGHTVVTTSQLSAVRAWDVDTGKRVGRDVGEEYETEYPLISPDGRQVFLGGSGKGGPGCGTLKSARKFGTCRRRNG